MSELGGTLMDLMNAQNLISVYYPVRWIWTGTCKAFMMLLSI